MIEFFEQKISLSSENPIILSNPSAISQNLPLIIKRYDFPNTLSSLIHKSNINEKFEIQGPLVKNFICFYLKFKKNYIFVVFMKKKFSCIILKINFIVF